MTRRDALKQASRKPHKKELPMKDVLDYLTDLSQNNNREWFHANKDRYQNANTAFVRCIGELITAIGAFDAGILHNSPKELTFKMMRDTRFSRDKSPYNPMFRAHIAPAGKLPIPVGYYVAIAPGDRSFLGGGLFASMFKDATAMVRDHIAANGEAFGALLREEAFAARYRVKGEALKQVPKEYDATHPQAEYLKYKSWYVEAFVPDEAVADTDGFVRRAARAFRAMKPLNDYLNAALRNFKMPAR